MPDVVEVVREPPICRPKARAWLQQAKVDYKAAAEIVGTSSSASEGVKATGTSSSASERAEAVGNSFSASEGAGISSSASESSLHVAQTCKFPALVCFLCHDVVEKCLKGLLYIYAEEAKWSASRSNLVTLVQQFKDKADRAAALHDVCNNTVMVVSVYESKTRYPSFHNPPCAPAEVYLHGDAMEAFSAVSVLMRKLLDTEVVHDILGDLKDVPKPRFISSLKSTTNTSK